VGPLTSDGLRKAGKATSHLAEHAENLLFVSGIRWPYPHSGDSHANGFCQALTATEVFDLDDRARPTGPSADVVIASRVHPGADPLTLFAGNNRAYMGERLSFTEGGQRRASVPNPHTLYLELMGLARPGGGMTPEGERAARLLAESRNSIHDLVRDDLTALMGHPRLSSSDRQRLQQHFDAIRDMEIGMGGMGNDPTDRCSLDGLDTTRIEAYEDYVYDEATTTEETLRLHMSLVALAFACNYRRAATIQWGSPYDRTRYAVPSNPERFYFSWICHRIQSEGSSGDPIPNAEQAHAEIDAVRMQSFAAGLDHFKARGLEDQCFVMWTNHFRDGPAHSYANIPHIIWGNAGGYLKQGEHIDVGSVTNNLLHNTLISAAIQDTGTTMEDFGDVDTGGQIAAIRA
jgi:hypothetical protein